MKGKLNVKKNSFNSQKCVLSLFLCIEPSLIYFIIKFVSKNKSNLNTLFLPKFESYDDNSLLLSRLKSNSKSHETVDTIGEVFPTENDENSINVTAIETEMKTHENLSDENKPATVAATEVVTNGQILDEPMNTNLDEIESNDLVNVKSNTNNISLNKTLADQRFQAVLSKYSSNSSQMQSNSINSDSIPKQPSIKLKIKDGSSTLTTPKSSENLNIIIKKTNTHSESFQVNSVNSNQQGAIPKLKIKTTMTPTATNIVNQQFKSLKNSSGPSVYAYPISSKIKALSVNDDMEEEIDEKSELKEKSIEVEESLNISIEDDKDDLIKNKQCKFLLCLLEIVVNNF